ncbi:FMN reductase [Nocardia mangyaensis]|uniref:FMN reductase n=1 Tax=Nocardia mangyaensis TaxID=2213200 RepID=A0A1J0VWG0_9NOCA|nr:NAD(P)H-dependent oxidoreductase [Nocardia mangyaensis]APE36349.1 FMN reductase [Nocardia mangyaensis]
MSETRILTLVGSLRAGSINRQLAEAAVQTAPDGVDISIYEGLAEIPFYNEDLDVAGSVPAQAESLRAAVAAADAVLLLTPEYNGTLPAVLKNVIDWASRPYGTGAIKGKPVAVVSASISPNAAAWAHGDTVKSVGIAGGVVVEAATAQFATIGERFGQTHPAQDAEALTQLGATVHQLVAAVESARVNA